MKTFLRRPGVQSALGAVMAAYLRLIQRTLRWRHEGLDKAEAVLSGEQGAIGLFWHGRVFLCLGIGHIWLRRPRCASMASPSADGEIVAQAMARIGFPAFRISSAKPGDTAKARAAVAAFRQAMSFVAEGGVLIVTPDGPRGPNEVIAAGSLQIARRTGAPIWLMGIASAPAIRLETWDKAMIPLPFGRGATVWDGPYHVPADADDGAIETLRQDWSARMAAITRRAEALACGD